MTLFRKTNIFAALALASASMATVAADKISFKSTELAKGIYMLSGVGGFAGGNIGLSVGDDGVVMIDDAIAPMKDVLLETLEGVSKKKVDYLLNTHVHFDHTGNNLAMAKKGANIVAHENLRQHFLVKGIHKMDGSAEPAVKEILPVITYSESINFYLNDHDTHIFHTPNAHTDGDSVVHFKAANVIHMGDVIFNGMFPFIDLSSGGSIEGYIAAQQRIYLLTKVDTKIIPGHGPLATRADLKKSIDMLIEANDIIAKAIRQGKSEDEIVKSKALAKFDKDWSWSFITTEKMTRQVYQSLIKPKRYHHDGDEHHHH